MNELVNNKKENKPTGQWFMPDFLHSNGSSSRTAMNPRSAWST